MVNNNQCMLPKGLTTPEMLRQVKKKLFRNWIMLAILLVIFIFFGYLLYTNIRSIYKSYRDYHTNKTSFTSVSISKESNAKNPIDDNEVYNNPPVKTTYSLSDNNDTIRNRISKMKSEYRNYNKALRMKDAKSKDIVDEKIIDKTFDDY